MQAHDLPLVSTLAMGLSVAFLCGLVASKLRLSPIIGYLLAGILIGPYTPGIFADTAIAEELSEIGIVLLMFGVGMHFSLRDLLAVRRIAVPGACVQIAAATLLGVALALLWGWQLSEGLLFGLALSVASTVVMLRELEAGGLLASQGGRIAVGWLIVEDLIMVLALVLIPALAGSQAEGAAPLSAAAWAWLLLAPLGKVALFVLLMLVAGKRFFSRLLGLTAATRSRELFTLCVFAVALGVAYAAAHLFGISSALGAFFAGMMIRETTLSDEVAEKAQPFQDAFAVLFFVSVGMLFNPAILLEQPLKVMAVVAVILLGKSAAAFGLVRGFGYAAQPALLVSASLAQIGEFSFILASLGRSYGLISAEAHSLILAGALISIALNPLFFRAAHRLNGITS